MILVEGYGLTESSPVVSGNRLEDNEPASVGYPVPGMEIKRAETGELLVRSPSVMHGYWKRPEETQAAIDADGWLHTGDIVEIIANRIYIHGRIKELIVTSGNASTPSSWDRAIALLADGSVRLEPLLTEAVPLAEWDRAFEAVRAGRGLKFVIDPATGIEPRRNP